MAAVSRVARWAHLILATVFLAGVVVQFFLAGLAISGETSFDAHAGVGWIVQLVAIVIFLVALVARLGWAGIGLSLLLAVLVIVQTALPNADSGWVAALHPVNALVLFVLAHVIVRRDRAIIASPAAAV